MAALHGAPTPGPGPTNEANDIGDMAGFDPNAPDYDFETQTNDVNLWNLFDNESGNMFDMNVNVAENDAAVVRPLPKSNEHSPDQDCSQTFNNAAAMKTNGVDAFQNGNGIDSGALAASFNAPQPQQLPDDMALAVSMATSMAAGTSIMAPHPLQRTTSTHGNRQNGILQASVGAGGQAPPGYFPGQMTPQMPPQMSQMPQMPPRTMQMQRDNSYSSDPDVQRVEKELPGHLYYPTPRRQSSQSLQGQQAAQHMSRQQGSAQRSQQYMPRQQGQAQQFGIQQQAFQPNQAPQASVQGGAMHYSNQAMQNGSLYPAAVEQPQQTATSHWPQQQQQQQTQSQSQQQYYDEYMRWRMMQQQAMAQNQAHPMQFQARPSYPQSTANGANGPGASSVMMNTNQHQQLPAAAVKQSGSRAGTRGLPPKSDKTDIRVYSTAAGHVSNRPKEPAGGEGKDWRGSPNHTDHIWNLENIYPTEWYTGHGTADPEPHLQPVKREDIVVGMSSQRAVREGSKTAFASGAAWTLRKMMQQLSRELRKNRTIFGIRLLKEDRDIQAIERAVIDQFIRTNPPGIAGAACAERISWAYDEYYPGVFCLEGEDGKRRSLAELDAAWKKVNSELGTEQKVSFYNAGNGQSVLMTKEDLEASHAAVAKAEAAARAAAPAATGAAHNGTTATFRMTQFPGSGQAGTRAVQGSRESFFTTPEVPSSMGKAAQKQQSAQKQQAQTQGHAQTKETGQTEGNGKAPAASEKKPAKKTASMTAEEKQFGRALMFGRKTGYTLTGRTKQGSAQGQRYLTYGCSDGQFRLLEGQVLDEAMQRTQAAARARQNREAAMAAAAGTSNDAAAVAAPAAAAAGPSAAPKTTSPMDNKAATATTGAASTGAVLGPEDYAVQMLAANGNAGNAGGANNAGNFGNATASNAANGFNGSNTANGGDAGDAANNAGGASGATNAGTSGNAGNAIARSAYNIFIPANAGGATNASNTTNVGNTPRVSQAPQATQTPHVGNVGDAGIPATTGAFASSDYTTLGGELDPQEATVLSRTASESSNLDEMDGGQDLGLLQSGEYTLGGGDIVNMTAAQTFRNAMANANAHASNANKRRRIPDADSVSGTRKRMRHAYHQGLGQARREEEKHINPADIMLSGSVGGGF